MQESGYNHDAADRMHFSWAVFLLIYAEAETQGPGWFSILPGPGYMQALSHLENGRGQKDSCRILPVSLAEEDQVLGNIKGV